MEIDGADGIEATGLAAGSVGDGAVEASAQHGDSRPKKRQRREEEGGAGEALSVRCCLETACAWWLHHIACGRLHCRHQKRDVMLTDVMRLTLVVHRLLFDGRCVCRDDRCQASAVEVEAQR